MANVKKKAIVKKKREKKVQSGKQDENCITLSQCELKALSLYFCYKIE